MGIFITAYQRRTSKERITFLAADKTSATLGVTDVVRVKIGRATIPAFTPNLDISSGQTMNGGSTVTNVNPVTLTLGGGDLIPSIIPPGVYDVEASVVDMADGGKIKHIEEGTLVLHPTQGGDIT